MAGSAVFAADDLRHGLRPSISALRCWPVCGWIRDRAAARFSACRQLGQNAPHVIRGPTQCVDFPSVDEFVEHRGQSPVRKLSSPASAAPSSAHPLRPGWSRLAASCSRDSWQMAARWFHRALQFKNQQRPNPSPLARHVSDPARPANPQRFTAQNWD
jgi:hypothetical protein